MYQRLLGGALLSCMLTGNAVSAEPPTAAFVPWHSNEPELAIYARDTLTFCLTERGVLRFAPHDECAATVKRLNIDIERVFGIDDDEFQAIGQAANTDYVLGGAFTVMKQLQFTGWRKDISANLRLHRSDTGQEAGYWQTTTGFSFVSNSTSLDPKAMTDRAIENFCDKISEASKNGFKVEANTSSEDVMDTNY